MLLNRPTTGTVTVPLATAAPPSLQPSPAVTHVLCCPGCSFMSLLPSLLASHAYRQHGMASVTIYRCLLCSAASTQSDIMREHAAMYHGLSGDCNIFGQLTTEVVMAPETIERMRGTGSAGGGALTLLVGSKKRKSTVPERVASQSTFSIEEVLDSELTVQIQKPKKLRTAAAIADREPGSNWPSESRHLCKTERQIQLPSDCLQQSQQLLGGDIHDIQSDLALDLSVKGKVNKLAARPTLLQLARRSKELPQQQQQQQQQQQSEAGRHRQQMPLQSAAISREPAAAEISPQLSPQQQQQQQQRQNFTNSQNSHLAQWFAEHRTRPYPSTGETKSLALATGLSYSQVKKWFANKRMRSKSSATCVGARHSCSSVTGGGDHHDNNNEEEADVEEDPILSNGCYPIARVEFSPAGSSLASPDFDERRLEVIPMLV